MKSLLILVFLFSSSQIWGEASIYKKILENDCEITIYCDAVDEENTFLANKYYIEIKNNNKKNIIRTEWLTSRPEPRFYWIDNKLFRMDFGSSLAPSSSTYFYSKKLHVISREYSLATAFVDKDNNLILCADFNFTVYNIFYPEKHIVLDTPEDSIGGILWFSIGKRTYFKNKKLILEYNDENWTIKSKIYDLRKTGLY
jgi:hypothetical protein